MDFTLRRRPRVNWRPLRILMFVLSAGVMSTALMGCDFSARDYRLRITANVIVNGKAYSGSSVQTFHCREGGGFWGSMDVGGCTAKGEAVVVDLPGKTPLFLLFKGPHGDVTSDAHALTAGRGDRPWALSVAQMPQMVTFDDLNNPKSVKAVQPDALEKTFGDGVQLKSVVVENTFFFVTRGVLKKHIPWVYSLGRKSLSGKINISDSRLSSELYNIDFLT